MKEAWLDRGSKYRRTISNHLHIFIFFYSILSFNAVALRCDMWPVLYSLPLLTHTHTYIYCSNRLWASTFTDVSLVILYFCGLCL